MNTNNKKGFTIIEVVLVLAIAGLIMLMVFIALPALQRSQRDNQREQDLSRALTAVQSYQTNNQQAIPANSNAAWATFRTNYLTVAGDSYTDPLGKDYQFVMTTSGTVSGVDATDGSQTVVRVYVTVGATCNGESISTGQGSRSVALRMPLEGGGVACVSNN